MLVILFIYIFVQHFTLLFDMFVSTALRLQKCFTEAARQDEPEPEPSTTETPVRNETVDKEEGDSGIDANSQGSCSSNDVKSKEKRKDKKKKKSAVVPSGGKSDKENSPTPSPSSSSVDTAQATVVRPKPQLPSTPVLETPSANKENSRVNGSHISFQSKLILLNIYFVFPRYFYLNGTILYLTLVLFCSLVGITVTKI